MTTYALHGDICNLLLNSTLPFVKVESCNQRCRIQGDILRDRAAPGPVKRFGQAEPKAQPQQPEADKGQVNIFSGESPAGRLPTIFHCAVAVWVHHTL